MSSSNSILFLQRPARVSIVSLSERAEYSDAQLEEIKRASFQEGYTEARVFYEHLFAEAREEIRVLRDEQSVHVMDAIAEFDQKIAISLPAMAKEIAKSLFNGFVPPPELIESICRETLDQMFPENAGLEIIVCQKDADVITPLPENWIGKYPGIKVTVDATLKSGECMVRSRFGVVDARHKTRLASLVDNLQQP